MQLGPRGGIESATEPVAQADSRRQAAACGSSSTSEAGMMQQIVICACFIAGLLACASHTGEDEEESPTVTFTEEQRVLADQILSVCWFHKLWPLKLLKAQEPLGLHRAWRRRAFQRPAKPGGLRPIEVTICDLKLWGRGPSCMAQNPDIVPCHSTGWMAARWGARAPA